MYTYKINTKIFTNTKGETYSGRVLRRHKRIKSLENKTLYHKFVGTYMYLNPFLFIKNNNQSVFSEGFSPLEKKFSEGKVAHPVGCDSSL